MSIVSTVRSAYVSGVAFSAQGRAGDDEAAAAAGLPASTCCHTFSGDGHHGVPVERRDARARASRWCCLLAVAAVPAHRTHVCLQVLVTMAGVVSGP